MSIRTILKLDKEVYKKAKKRAGRLSFGDLDLGKVKTKLDRKTIYKDISF